MRPPGTSPLAPVDRDSWYCHVPGFLQDSDGWVQELMGSEPWERRLLLVKRKKGKEWVQGHRKWVFQSDDPQRILYRFSGIELQPHPYSETMLQFVKYIREQLTAHHLGWFKFNSVLMYLYDTPDTYCRSHKEDEPELGSNPTIGYLGLGQRREFVWSAEATESSLRLDTYTIRWKHGAGDLLIMGGTAQERWYHCVPSCTSDAAPKPRIGCLLLNITPGYHNGQIDFSQYA